MYQGAERSTKLERELGADVTALDRECEKVREDIKRLLAASGKLENSAQAILDYRDMPDKEFRARFPVGITWDELAGNARAALREWQTVVEEVEGGTDE